MCRRLRVFLASVAAVMGLVLPGQARADDVPVLVVDVTPSASALDAERLRTLIASELHAETVKPDDARAGSARGTITVDVDRKGGELSVAYSVRTAPTVRHVPLPADDEAARTTAVALAGNLARDEASDLASELRNKRPQAPTPGTPAAERDVAEDGTAAAASRLRHTLDYYAENERRSRRAYGWTSTVVGAVAMGVGISLDRSDGARFALYGGASFLGGGLSLLLSWGPFEDLIAFDRRGEGWEATEEEWRRAARKERDWRRTRGVILAVVGGLSLGAGTFVVAYRDLSISAGAREETATLLYALGAVATLNAVYMLATDGPLESALRAYEASTGRVASPKASLLRSLRVGVAPGGAMGTFSVTF